jgi:adenine-specific DNA-methyltransferase
LEHWLRTAVVSREAAMAPVPVRLAMAEDVTRQPEQIKAFREIWELGIHSYLTYRRDRLTIARELLGDSGSMFV